MGKFETAMSKRQLFSLHGRPLRPKTPGWPPYLSEISLAFSKFTDDQRSVVTTSNIRPAFMRFQETGRTVMKTATTNMNPDHRNNLLSRCNLISLTSDMAC